MGFGTGRAGTVCPWPERLILDRSRSALVCWSCMRETKFTSKHELAYIVFTCPFQTMRVCQLLRAYFCNFLVSIWIYILWCVYYMLLPDIGYNHSLPTGGINHAAARVQSACLHVHYVGRGEGKSP